MPRYIASNSSEDACISAGTGHFRLLLLPTYWLYCYIDIFLYNPFFIFLIVKPIAFFSAR